MEKTEILSELNSARSQLETYRAKLRTLEEKLAAVDAFSAQCASRIRSFEESMGRRKSRLLSFESLLSRVKAAAKYKDKMSNMLNGSEYNATVASIDHLQTSISSERRKVIEDIRYVEDQIAYYESRVESLQYQYDTYPEEVDESVQ